jgi:hypothetical protein
MLTPMETLERLYTEAIENVQFSEQFLQAASQSQVEQIIMQLNQSQYQPVSISISFNINKFQYLSQTSQNKTQTT